MALILRNERHDRRQLGLLKARRRGIIGCGVGRQSRLAVLTLPGHEGHKAIDAFGGRQLLQPRRMAPLAAGLAFRFLLADRLGRSERIGRRGHGGIGAVGAEPRFQRGDTLLQLGDTSVTGAASSTLRRVHAAMLENRAAQLRLFPQESELNGYLDFRSRQSPIVGQAATRSCPTRRIRMNFESVQEWRPAAKSSSRTSTRGSRAATKATRKRPERSSKTGKSSQAARIALRGWTVFPPDLPARDGHGGQGRDDQPRSWVQ